MPAIDVLLATYNGEKYLERQLFSVLNQSVDVRILIRDDGSTDGTRAIIDRFATLRPDVVYPVRDTRGNIGVIGNFATLLDQSTAPYVMFCDQDDVWLPGKIADSLDEMRAAEAEAGNNTPVLVYTDAIVADDEARPIASSFFKFIGVDPRPHDLKTIMLFNRVIGCTAILNRALVAGASPIPAEATMHDWWFALYAAAFGKMRFIPRGTLLYRQHSGNQVGAQRYGLRTLLRIGPTRIKNVRRNLHRGIKQAAIFIDRFGGRLDARQRQLLQGYADLPKRSWIVRRLKAAMLGYGTTGTMRTAMFILIV